MPFYFNIHQIKVNSMSSNSSINIGPVSHSSHSAHTKWVGSNLSTGDHSPSEGFYINEYVQEDLVDESEIGTTEDDLANQL